MKASEPSLPTAIGFISLLDCESLGWVGGYLIVNSQGRPLEFHCTVPVTPHRAQEILYGATFAPFFFGELIGQALLKRGKTPPELVLTDHPGVLGAREFLPIPLLYLNVADSTTHTQRPSELAVQLKPHNDFPGDLESGRQLLSRLPTSWALIEPFERIEQAVREAQRAA